MKGSNTLERVILWILVVLTVALIVEVIHLRIDLHGISSFIGKAISRTLVF